MRILVFAPNAGASLSTGGGVNFVLKQASALTELGHEVTLAGFHALPAAELSQIHSVDLPPSVRIVSARSTLAYRTARVAPVKLSAYDMLLDPRFRGWIGSTIREARPEAIWFHDDIPASALAHRGSTPFFLYVHFPLRGHSSSVCPAMVRSPTERANDELLRALDKLLVVPNPFDVCEGVWTNSSVTSRVVSRVWGPGAVYLPTYVPPPRRSEGGAPARSHSVVAVGTFGPGKGYDDLVDGFSAARIDGWRLQIVGHERGRSYLERLRRKIQTLRMGGRIELVVSPDREALQAIVQAADAVVQAARFEPFGLSLLEGMAFGLGGLARRGEFSGGWLDILAEGQFGLGFGDPRELADQLARIAASPELLAGLRDKAFARAGEFGRDRFVARFREIHGDGSSAHAS